jgi:hypothetical protein
MKSSNKIIVLTLLYSTTLANATLYAIPEEVLSHFLEPVKLVYASMYKDGGTIVIRLKDLKGQNLIFCRDGRMRVFVPGEKAILNAPRLYFGEYPTAESSKPIERGSESEQHILKLLKAWKAAGSEFSREDQLNTSVLVVKQSPIEMQKLWVDSVIQSLESK